MVEKFLVFLSMFTGIGGLCFLTWTCIKPKNVKESLIWEGSVVLYTNGDRDDEEFKKLIAEHEKTSGSNRMDGLSLEGKTEENDKLEAIKTRCRGLFAVLLENAESMSKKKTAKDWCTKSSPYLS